jgi:hypothetical protein
MASEEEPPVPPGLRTLSPALRDWAHFLEIDEHLLKVTVQASDKLETPADDTLTLRRAITQLSREECDVYLLRLAQGEPHLDMEIRTRLRESLGTAPRTESVSRRKARQLLKAAQQERQVEEAEARRVAELEALFQRQKQTWQVVEELIRKSNSGAYREAADLLTRLEQATTLKGQGADFEARLRELRERYKTRPALRAGWARFFQLAQQGLGSIMQIGCVGLQHSSRQGALIQKWVKAVHI